MNTYDVNYIFNQISNLINKETFWEKCVLISLSQGKLPGESIRIANELMQASPNKEK